MEGEDRLEAGGEDDERRQSGDGEADGGGRGNRSAGPDGDADGEEDHPRGAALADGRAERRKLLLVTRGAGGRGRIDHRGSRLCHGRDRTPAAGRAIWSRWNGSCISGACTLTAPRRRTGTRPRVDE